MFLPSINELLQVNVTLKLVPRHCLLMELTDAIQSPMLDKKQRNLQKKVTPTDAYGL